MENQKKCGDLPVESASLAIPGVVPLETSEASGLREPPVVMTDGGWLSRLGLPHTRPGQRLQKTNWKDPAFSSWVNIHYFDWAMFNSFVLTFTTFLIPFEILCPVAAFWMTDMPDWSIGIWLDIQSDWLVVTGSLEFWMTFPSDWECHHPNWRTPSFFRGVVKNHQADLQLPSFSQKKNGDFTRRIIPSDSCGV